MATRAFKALLDVARRTGPLTEGVATGGSSTTIVDTVRLGVLEFLADDELNGGSAFIITDAGGQGAAPENETARIDDYTASSGTVVVRAGDFSAAPAAGDIYGVTVIPRYQLFQAINSALADLGRIPVVNESLTTTSGTLEYTLPTGIEPEAVFQVWVQSNTSRPYDWRPIMCWRVVQGASSYNLELGEPQPPDCTLRLVYAAPHPNVDDDSDFIESCVPWDYLVWQSAAYVYQRRLLQVGVNREHWTGLMNHAFQMAANALKLHPVPYPMRYPRLPVTR